MTGKRQKKPRFFRISTKPGSRDDCEIRAVNMNLVGTWAAKQVPRKIEKPLPLRTKAQRENAVAEWQRRNGTELRKATKQSLCQTARVDRADLYRWIEVELKDTSVMAERIRRTLSE